MLDRLQEKVFYFLVPVHSLNRLLQHTWLFQCPHLTLTQLSQQVRDFQCWCTQPPPPPPPTASYRPHPLTPCILLSKVLAWNAPSEMFLPLWTTCQDHNSKILGSSPWQISEKSWSSLRECYLFSSLLRCHQCRTHPWERLLLGHLCPVGSNLLLVSFLVTSFEFSLFLLVWAWYSQIFN